MRRNLKDDKKKKRSEEKERRHECVLPPIVRAWLEDERKRGVEKQKIVDNNKKIDVKLVVVNKQKLTDRPEFREYAWKHQWKARREMGVDSEMSAIEFIRTFYKEWIEEGLVRADIRDVDRTLWEQLRKELRDLRRKLRALGIEEPEALVREAWVPTEAEAALEPLSDEERERMNIIRQYEREKKRYYRSRKKKAQL